MTPDAPPPPPAARQLGDELRRLRRNAGFSGPQLAGELGWSQSKVSRLETADRRPHPQEIGRWLTATGADETTTDAVRRLAEQAAAAWRAHRESNPPGTIRLAPQALAALRAAADRCGLELNEAANRAAVVFDLTTQLAATNGQLFVPPRRSRSELSDRPKGSPLAEVKIWERDET